MKLLTASTQSTSGPQGQARDCAPAQAPGLNTTALKANARRRHSSQNKIKEEAIHRAVVDLLKVSARPGVAWTHMPSGEARGPGIGGKLKGLGTKPGWPDLLLVRKGHLHGLELKCKDGRLSPAQIAAHEELTAAGAFVCVAYGLDEAIRVLKGWGMVR